MRGKTTLPGHHIARPEGETPLLLQRHEVAKPDGREGDEAVVAGLEVCPALLGAVQDGPARY